MKKEDIDIYLSKMKSGISDEEKLQISKEFYEAYVRDHMELNSDGTVRFETSTSTLNVFSIRWSNLTTT